MKNEGNLKIGIKMKLHVAIKNLYNILKNSMEKVFLRLRKG